MSEQEPLKHGPITLTKTNGFVMGRADVTDPRLCNEHTLLAVRSGRQTPGGPLEEISTVVSLNNTGDSNMGNEWDTIVVRDTFVSPTVRHAIAEATNRFATQLFPASPIR